jgi:AraC-like DNA-binding protein
MFKHIYFVIEESLSDFSKLAPRVGERESYDEFIRENPESQKALAGDFLMEGQVKALPEIPISKEYGHKIMNLQAFSWMCMGHNYYTHRKNYQSYLLLYTYEGEGELLYEGNTYELQEGNGFLIDCRREHTYRTLGTKWVHSDLHFDSGMSEYLYEQCFQGRTPLFHCPKTGEYQRKLEQLLLCHTSSMQNREFIVSAKLQELMMYILCLQNTVDDSGNVPDDIFYLQKYLEHHFTADITLEDMAKFCNLSKYHMIRQFKKYTSYTPKEYVIYLRIARAKQLLIDTQIPSYKIGMMVGMNNEANFIHVFKDRVGKTPKEYREGK